MNVIEEIAALKTRLAIIESNPASANSVWDTNRCLMVNEKELIHKRLRKLKRRKEDIEAVVRNMIKEDK